MTKGITFFAKDAFLNVSPSGPYVHNGTKPRRGHLMRVSSMIRGRQIAKFIGAKLNPTKGYKNDVCIYVKPYIDANFKFEGEAYLDICDNIKLCDLARRNPEVVVIAASDWNYELLKKMLPNKVINIPEQHCNFERVKKSREGISSVGCIGGRLAFDYLPIGLKEELAKRGITLIEFSRFFTREDIINYYLNVDIQIIWRPYFDYAQNILMNPLKIVNSASFGIPTIAYDEPTFAEMEGCYLPVNNLDGFLYELDNLRTNPSLYAKYSENCLKKAEEYHIEKISKLYLDLI